MSIRSAAAVLVYIGAITTANLLVARYGPGVSVLNAFLLIGLDLTMRDWLHDIWREHRAVKLTALIAAAGLISWALNPAAGRIAIASAVAFVVAALCDWGVYHLMRRRTWSERANTSNIVGAGADSLVFPVLAFGFPVLWVIVLGQFTAKVAGGAVWASIIAMVKSRRAAAHG